MAGNVRDGLVATAARLIGQRGGAGVSVRDIAREAGVADGALYNYFADKEDLLAHALAEHVGTVVAGLPAMPEPGTGTVAGNLGSFIESGVESLGRVLPAFAGMLSQPGVLARFHALVGGDTAFGGPAEAEGPAPAQAEGPAPAQADGDTPAQADGDDRGKGGDGPGDGGEHPQGLPARLGRYLRAEQALGRVDPAADVDAAVSLVVGAIHGEVLPKALFPPGGGLAGLPPGLALRLAQTVLSGIGPRCPRPGS